VNGGVLFSFFFRVIELVIYLVGLTCHDEEEADSERRLVYL
jgi:hypothetical protein